MKQEFVLRLALSGVFGVILGSLLTQFTSPHYILLIAAGIILVVGLKFVYYIFGRQASMERNTLLNENWAWLLGALAGVYSGFLGLGGGLLIVPALVLLFGEDIKQAVGTSLATIAFYALPGSVVHYFLGHVDVKLIFWLIVGLVPGAYLGANLAIKLNEKVLRVLFGLFLILTASCFAYFEIANF